jgi:hypothetical protein
MTDNYMVRVGTPEWHWLVSLPYEEMAHYREEVRQGRTTWQKIIEDRNKEEDDEQQG